MLWREAVRSYPESGHRIATAGLVSTADNSSYRNLSNARFTPRFMLKLMLALQLYLAIRLLLLSTTHSGRVCL